MISPWSVSRKHPAGPPSGRTLAPSLTLLADDIHLITFLDEMVIGRKCGNGFGFLDIRPSDEFAFLEFPRMFEELVLETVVDVFLDDDVFFVSLQWVSENVSNPGKSTQGSHRRRKNIPHPIPMVVHMHPACQDGGTSD